MLHILLKHFEAFYQQNILFAFAGFFARAKQPAKMPDSATIKSQRLGLFQSPQQPYFRPSVPLSSKYHYRVLGFMNFEDLWRPSNAVRSRSSSKGFLIDIQFNVSLSKPFRGVRKAKHLEGLRIQDMAIMQGYDVCGFRR